MTLPTNPSPLSTAAVVVSSTVVLLPLLLAKLVEYRLKAANPNGVDTTQPLAYLQPILITGWVSVAVLTGLAVVLNVATQRRHGSARLAWLVLGVQLVLGLAFVAAQASVDSLMP